MMVPGGTTAEFRVWDGIAIRALGVAADRDSRLVGGLPDAHDL